jgi:small subunit ribosomal protein S3Ae
MSLGKNKRNFSKGRKGAKKKVGERFLKKEWWNIKAPGMFGKRLFTQSPVNQTVGKKLASDSMKGRVFEANLGDLNQGYETHKKIKLIVEDADGKSKIALTNFYGLECTRDYLCSLIRKWHTLIDTFVDCKTSDGFLMRFFIVGFTSMYRANKNPRKYVYQKKATCYANRSQVKQMRAIMTKIITKVCKASTMKELVYKVLGNEITDEMTKKCKAIFPLENITIRKVKSIKRPKVDANQLNDMHMNMDNWAGVKIEKKEEEQKEEAFV